jgi:hypothetical protein
MQATGTTETVLGLPTLSGGQPISFLAQEHVNEDSENAPGCRTDQMPQLVVHRNQGEVYAAQLQFLTRTLQHETAQHNQTRIALQYYRSSVLFWERLHAQERMHNRSLSSIIDTLQGSTQDAETKRFVAEQKLEALQQEIDFLSKKPDNLSVVSALMN